jgi:hypothetical protein
MARAFAAIHPAHGDGAAPAQGNARGDEENVGP